MSKDRKFYTEHIHREYFTCRIPEGSQSRLYDPSLKEKCASRNFTRTVKIDEFPESVIAEIREREAEEAE